MKMFKLILTTVAISMAVLAANAEEKKAKAAAKGGERTVKGTIMCAKCTLKKTDACQAALEVKRKGKGGKEVARVILLKNNDVTKAFHAKICGGDKIAVAVTGKREGKGKKRVLVVSKIDDAPAKKGGKSRKEKNAANKKKKEA